MLHSVGVAAFYVIRCRCFADAKWTKKLEFESGTDKMGPKLDPVPDRPNCFTIGGKVDVLEVGISELELRLHRNAR